MFQRRREGVPALGGEVKQEVERLGGGGDERRGGGGDEAEEARRGEKHSGAGGGGRAAQPVADHVRGVVGQVLHQHLGGEPWMSVSIAG
jgi:hypothetical protein